MAACLLGSVAVAYGADVPPSTEKIALNTVWVLVAGALVMFMQNGFAMVETGFTTAKNACNIIMKNLMDFAFGRVIF